MAMGSGKGGIHVHRTADSNVVADSGGELANEAISRVFARRTAIGQPGMPDRSR